MTTESVPVNAIAYGVDDQAATMLRSALPRLQMVDLPLDISRMLKAQSDTEPDLIFCGQPDGNVSLLEVVQGIRAMYTHSPVYYVTSQRRGFDRKSLMKAGFVEAFLLPMDHATVRELIFDGSEEFKSVPLVDIKPETVLDFDTYLLLPINRKYIRFSMAGFALDSVRVQRLLDHHVATVQIARKDLKKFYEFTAAQLKNLATEGTSSESERRQRMHEAVRSLLTGFLTNSAELQDCSQIVHSYILTSTQENASLYEKILRLTGTGGEGYVHVTNVATIAALIMMDLMPDQVEAVALAGMLHDIGMANLPPELQNKDEKEMTVSQRILFHKHPQHSIDLIRARNIQIPELVLRAILQHHERFDGTGFPEKILGKALCKEAQIIAIADELDHLTAVRVGHARRTVQDALQAIFMSPAYDPALLGTISDLFRKTS